MLKLAMLLSNPGELADSRYRDPRHLRELGYNGLVLWETTALSGVQSPDILGTGEMRRWVEQQLEVVRSKIEQAVGAGMAVYLTYDVLSMAREAVNRESELLLCKSRAATLCPGSDEALDRSASALEALLHRLPPVDGVVLRFGDTEARRFPYLVGNDIYLPHCPRCSQLDRVDRISRVLRKFHELVITRLNKRLIARAWNVRPGGMHDSVEICQRLREQLPGDETDDRFILSFKFTETDFWRYQKWNACSLVFGQRPVLYELQCQREFEGKGGIPNWQVPLWRDGYPETRSPDRLSGLANVAEQVNLAGLWAWVRGGGWGGPFVRNEMWVDANVSAVPLLADNPQTAVSELGAQWIRDRLNLTHPDSIAAVQQVLDASPEFVLQGFYVGPYVKGRNNPWHPNGDFIQDDLIDTQAAWRMVQQLPENALDDVVREKQQAVDQVGKNRALLQQVISERSERALEPLLNTLVYTESLFETLRDLFAGLVAYRRFLRTRDPALAQQCRSRLFNAQSYWQHHTQRHASISGVATAFRESHFWELTQKILAEIEEPASR